MLLMLSLESDVLCVQVLDENYELGNIILPMSMILLQYCPSPQRYASDYQPPNYTVWLLEPMIRHCWLTALLVILYKVSQLFMIVLFMAEIFHS